MSELDPLTNLPKKDPTPAKPGPVQGKKPSLAQLKQSHRQLGRLGGGEGSTVQGTFGEYGPGANITSNKNFNEIRAQGQTFGQLFGRSLAQSAGTVLGMGLEAAGFIADIPSTVESMITGSQMDFERNILSEAGNNIEEWTQENFQIYKTDQVNNGELGRFFDATYWASNMPSIASTLSLMFPAGLAGRAVMTGARLLGAGKRGMQAAELLGATLTSRHMEGYLEAYETLDQTYQQAINNGMSEVEARQLAGTQAAETYKRGYSNVLLDLMQWGAILRPINYASRASKGSIMDWGAASGDEKLSTIAAVLKRNPLLTIKDAVRKSGYDWKDFVGQSISEGFEEFNQEFIKRIATHNTDIALGVTEGRELSYGEAWGSSLLAEHVGESETWDAALLGFLGGAAFQGAGLAANKYRESQSADNVERQRNSQREMFGYIEETMKNINYHMQAGEDYKAQREKQSMLFNLAINGMESESANFGGAAIEGNVDAVIEMFSAIDGMTAEELETLGFDESSKDIAKDVTKELQNIKTKINEFYNNTNTSDTKLDGPLAIMQAEQAYRMEKAQEGINLLEGNISEVLNNSEDIGKIMESLTGEQRTMVEDLLELDSITNTLKAIENMPDAPYGIAPYRAKMLKKASESAINKMKQRQQELAQQIGNRVPQGSSKYVLGNIEIEPKGADSLEETLLSKEDTTQVKKITKQLGESRLGQMFRDKAETQAEREISKIMLRELATPGNHEAIREAMEATDEKLKKLSAEYLIKDKYRGGEFMMFESEDKDGNPQVSYGRIFFDGDKTQILPVNGKGDAIGSLRDITDLDKMENILNATPLDYEKLYTDEEAEQINVEFKKALLAKNFPKAYRMLQEVFSKSRIAYQTSERAKELMNELKDYLQNVNSAEELRTTINSIGATFEGRLLNEAWSMARQRIIDLQTEIETEINGIEDAIRAKEVQLEETEQEFEEILQDINDLKKAKEDQIETIFNDLVEQEAKGELSNIDRRTKPARAIEKMEKQIADLDIRLKQTETQIKAQEKEVAKDIKVLEKLKNRAEQFGFKPSSFIEGKQVSLKNEMDYIRSHFLFQMDITEEKAQQLKNGYQNLYTELEQAITAVEKFREYLGTINDASGVIRKATRKAYKDLLEEGLLTEDMSLFGDVPQSVFERFMVKFNKNLTDGIANLDKGQRFEGIRKLVNETRLKSDTFPTDASYWAAFDIDYPIFSDLFQSAELDLIGKASNHINRFLEIRREYESYDFALNMMKENMQIQRISLAGRKVKGKGKIPNSQEDRDIKRDFIPQPPIDDVFLRPAGNSGDNQKYNTDASQRRYTRYINKTNFKAEDNQHYVELMLAPEEYKVPEPYDKDNVLLAVLTDENGKYLKEDGTVTDTFSLEENLYTTMKEATWEYPGKYTRTFEPTAGYLKRNFAGDSHEERLENYNSEKDRIRQAYEVQRLQWQESLRNGDKVMLAVTGKSAGVQNADLDNPRSLGKVFNDLDAVNLRVQLREDSILNEDLVKVPPGYVIIEDEVSGNSMEGHVRNLNTDEQNTILRVLKSYAANSTVDSKGRLNYGKDAEEKAGTLTNSDGSVVSTKRAFQVVRDLIYSFESESRIYLDGKNMIVDNTSYPILALKSDGESARLNPELESALKETLSDIRVQVRSELLNKNSEGKDQSYEHVLFKKGKFVVTEYPTYKDYLLKQDIVQTYLQQTPTLSNGEKGFDFFNQNVILDSEQVNLGTKSGRNVKQSKTRRILKQTVKGKEIYDIGKLPNGTYVFGFTDPRVPAQMEFTKGEDVIDISFVKESFEDPKLADEAMSADAGELFQIFENAFKAGELQIISKDGKATRIRIPQRNIPETPAGVPKVPSIKEPPVPGNIPPVPNSIPDIPTPEEGEHIPADLDSELNALEDAVDAPFEGDDSAPEIANKTIEDDTSDADWMLGTKSNPLEDSVFRHIANRLTEATGIPIKVISLGEAVEMLEYIDPDEVYTKDNVPLGMYYQGVAYMFTDGKVNSETLFHEVGHAVIYQIMDQNPDLAYQLLEELRSTEKGRAIIEHVKTNYKKTAIGDTLTTKGVAEALTTALGREASGNFDNKSFIDRVLDIIRNFFRSLFGNDIRVNELSANTTMKELGQMLASAQDLQLTPSLIKTNELNFHQRENQLKSVKFTNDTMNMMNNLFFEYLYNEQPGKLHALFTNQERAQLYEDAMKYAQTRLQQALVDQKRYVENNPKKATQRNLDYIENILYLKNNWSKAKKIHTTHLQRINIEAVTEETFNEAKSTAKDSNKLFQEESIKFSAKQNATSMVRFIVASLESNKVNDSYPITKNVDFGKAFNILANHMAGTTTLKEKRSIAYALEREGVEGMVTLINRIFGTKATESMVSDVNMMLQFNEAFSKHFNEYRIAFADNGGYELQDATVNTATRRLKEKWYSSSIAIDGLYKDSGDNKVYNPEYTKRFPEDMSILTNKLPKWYKQKLKGVQPNMRKQWARYYSMVHFLRQIGMDVTADVMPRGEHWAEFANAVQYIYDHVKEGNKVNIFEAEGDSVDNLKSILEHEINHSVINVENQHYSLEGETVHNVVLNHYISLINDKFNNSQYESLNALLEELPHLNTPYSSNSLIINPDTAYFNKKGARKKPLIINITEGMKGNNEGISFHKLDHSDKIRVQMNSILSGQYPLFRAGDKKLERFVEFGKFFNADKIRDELVHYDAFVGYLADELNYIKEYREELATYKHAQALTGEDWIEYTTVAKMFAVNDTVKKVFDEFVKGERTDYTDAVPFFRDALRNHFEGKIDEHIEYLEEYKIVEKKGDSYKNNGLKGLSDNKLVKYNRGQLENIVRYVLVNQAVANIEQTKLFTGHPAFYKNSDNFFHRMSGALGTKKISSTGHYANQLLNTFFPNKSRLYKPNGSFEKTTEYKRGSKPIIRTAVFEDPKVKSRYYDELVELLGDEASAYGQMEEPDAIGYISLDAYRDMKLRGGEWTEAQERLYQWEHREAGETSIEFVDWVTREVVTLTEEDLVNADGKRTTFNMIKPQYFGPMAEEGFIPGMYKLSLIPVLPSYNTDGFKKMRKKMSEHNVGIITFESANKVGTINPGETAYKDGVPNFNEVTYQDTYYDYWGLQLQTGTSVKDKVIIGSQFMKQIMDGIYDKGEALEGLGESANKMTRIHSELIDLGIKELKKELGLKLENGSYRIKDIGRLVDFLTDEAIKRDANNNVLDSLDKLRTLIKQDVGLDILSNRDKVENILASIADSRVISQKMPGGAKVQAASTFFEENPRVPDKDGNLISNELKFYEDGTMEVLLPHYFKGMDNIKATDIIDKELLNAVAFRIPTSGLNVIERITIKGFLPQSAGETIVLPTEIVAKAGSDFDIDKLNIFLPNYVMEGDNPRYIRFLDSPEAAIKLINSIAKEKPQFFGKDGMAKVPTMIKLLKKRGYPKVADLLKKYQGDFEKKILDHHFKDLNTKEGLQNGLIEVSSEIISHPDNRRNLLRPISIQMLKDLKDEIDGIRGETYDSNYLNMLTDFKFQNRITQRNIESIAGTGIAALHASDHIHSTRYNYYMRSEHVMRLPHNEYQDNISLAGRKDVEGQNEIGNTLNQIVNMFIDGVKDPISYSLNLNLQTVSTALYMIRAGVPVDNVMYMLNQPAVRQYIRYKGIQNSLSNENDKFMSDDRIKLLLKKEFGTDEADVDITKDLLKSQIGDSSKEVQRLLLNEFIIIESQAKELSRYVNSTRIDTNAMGKNTSELELYLSDLESIANRETAVMNADRLVTNKMENATPGFLEPHYRALLEFRQMFTPFFTHYKDTDSSTIYSGVLDWVASKQIPKDAKIRILDRLKMDLLTYRLLNNEIKIGNQKVVIKGKEQLMVGDNSLPRRLMKMKRAGVDNMLVDYLLPILARKKHSGKLFDNLKLANQRMDITEQNQLIEAWRELFDQYPVEAVDLVQFIIMQSGLQLSPITFSKYIPAEIYTEMLSYTAGTSINYVEFLEQFFLNNYNDDYLVPKSKKDKKGYPVTKQFLSKPGVTLEDKRKGISPWQTVPMIRITNNEEDLRAFLPEAQLFENEGRTIEPRSFKDFRNSSTVQEYALYRDEETAPREPVEPANEPEETLIKKVISGGQTGIDRLGLDLASTYNLETGGTAPKGFKTEEGSDPSLADLGVVESESSSYTERTEQNVLNSDATIYFATDEDSAGLKATKGFAEKHNKPFLLNPTSVADVKKWLTDNNVETLNIAGNRGSKLDKRTKLEAEYILKSIFKAGPLSDTVRQMQKNPERSLKDTMINAKNCKPKT